MSSRRSLPGFGAPAAGFDAPFEMLEACHERVDRSLQLLARLRHYLHEHGVDESVRQAARDVLRYFDMAAPLHHQDEELHIFPRLLASANPATADLVKRLQSDHLHMDADWRSARVPLQALADGGIDHFRSEQEAQFDAFAARYADHIRAEEDIAYPGVRAWMSADDTAAMGREMAARRGAKY